MGEVLTYMRRGLGWKKDVVGPLRYPGSKQWFIPQARMFVQGRRPELWTEPFGGGGAVGLTLLSTDMVGHFLFSEKDARVAAFWRRALNDPSFADEVADFQCTLENVKAVVADTSEANYPLWVLVKGRCGFGGVLDNAGLKKKDVGEKWCPHVVVPALKRVYELRGRISLVEGDGIQVLRDHRDTRACCFADPPYTAEANGGPGRHLYKEHRLDHTELFGVLAEWEGRWLMTHSDSPEVRDLVQRHGLQSKQLRMTGNTGQRCELAIGPDLRAISGPEYSKPTVQPGITLHDEMRQPATACTSPAVLKGRGVKNALDLDQELGLTCSRRRPSRPAGLARRS